MQSCNEKEDFVNEELEERAALECEDNSTTGVKIENLSEAASEPSEEESGEDEPESSSTKSSYVQIPYGFQSRGTYRHASKNCEIGGVTYNSRQRQFVILDSRGITSWSYESVTSTVSRHMNYPAYQFNVLRLIIYSRKFNVYFILSKEYALKVFNMNFHEVFSVSAEMHSVLCMVFNPVRNELITGGTGGMKFWTFGERQSDRRKTWDRDSRPMANYGLVLRAEYPDMGGSWVKQVELDETMQRLYCLSERHVVAYDMVGNQLFQIIEAHRGPVTGCVYSKACNFLVTAGNDCDVNVWSGNCRNVHTFTGHTKVITKIMLHPDTSSLVFTASLDGHVKVYSLDVMEEIYSLPVHPEGIIWMETVSNKVFYCCSYRVVEVFSINHVTDFWALTRCSLKSLSLVRSEGKSTRVMAVGEDSSVRLFSRKGHKLTTVLPPPPISPFQQVLDVAYNRETGMMYLLVSSTEIWVYYTRTNPATRLEAWELDLIEDVHYQHSQDMLGRSRSGASWVREASSSLSQTSAHRSPSPFLGPSRSGTSWEGGPPWLSPGSPSESMLHSRGESVQCSSVGMLYSHIIMDSVEGEACPDMTSFLMAGLQDGRVLFLNMYCKGLKYSELQAHKDAVLRVKHDQETNTLVTECKSFHGTLVLQIWSLPYLDLQQQVTCDGDLACFVRMDHLLMSGYESGYLKLQLLGGDGCDTCTSLASEEKASEFKRTPPKDHQLAVCSLDASRPLGIFCSSSKDGYLKLWDKEKTLLREIVFDNTLNVVCFLNLQGDLLIGYKYQIFIISHNRVHPVKERVVDEHGTSLHEDVFETESDIYEDPSVKYESKKILQPDPTDMENYLVPFPNLHLTTSWFMDMEGRVPPELMQDKQQQQEEVASLFSDDLSLAPTEIYLSPGSTPRTLSLASLPMLEERLARVAQERKGCQDTWQLPEFGESPVSSPPRTPPPEPTPPSTPSMGGGSEEENDDEKGQFVDQKLDDQSPCETCEVDIKKDVKKTPNLAIFKREGGRLGNIKVDSSAVRMAARSGGYAAPIVRMVTVQKPEPKPFKPRRPPRTITKKTRKLKPEDPAKKTDEANKDTPLEEQQAQQNQQDGSVQAHTAGTAAQNLNGSRLNPDGTMGDIAPKDGEKTGQESVKGQWPPTGPTRNRPLFGGPENGTSVDGLSGSHQSPGGGKTGVISEGEQVAGNHNPQDSESTGFIDLRSGPGRGLSQGTGRLTPGKVEEDTATGRTSHDAKGPDDPRDQAPGSRMVRYVDPESGELVESAINEVPDGAEIVEEGGEEEEEAIEEDEDAPSRSSLKRDRDLGKSKTVSFNVDRKGRMRNSGNRRAHSAEGAQGGAGRFWSRTSHTRSTVMPLYEPQAEGRLETRKSKSNMSVSPLTIFALARNRRRNINKLDQNRSDLSQATQASAQPHMYQGFSVQGYKDMSSHSSWERDADSVTQFMENMHVNETAESDSEGIQTARRSDSNVMSWCIRALKKSSPSLLLPQKPTRSRPQSSPSISSVAKSHTEGQTLYLNYAQEGSRPKTADSLNTVDTSRSYDEHTMYPYLNNPPPTPELREETTSSQGAHIDRHKSVRGLRVKHRLTKTRGQSSGDEDLDEMCCNMEANLAAYSSDIRINYKRSLRSGSLSDSESFILRPIPPLDVNDYSENWHEKLIERAHLLKQQRLDRHKSAVERRHRLEDKKRQRWKNSGHYACAQEPSPKSEKDIEFLPPSSPSAAETSAGKSERYPPQSPNLKEQELSSERPFRLRLNLLQEENRLTSAARGLISLRSSEHNVSDVVNALPRPTSAISIPSKCNRYVLVTGEQKPADPKVTPLEKSLLMLRFPKSPTRRRYQPEGSVTRPRSTQDIYVGVT